jgi:hypothetical protein
MAALDAVVAIRIIEAEEDGPPADPGIDRRARSPARLSAPVSALTRDMLRVWESDAGQGRRSWPGSVARRAGLAGGGHELDNDGLGIW